MSINSDPQPDFEAFVMRREMVERLRLVGPTDDRQRVLLELYGNGFTVKFCGAYTQESMFPFCDDTRFLIVAERMETGQLAAVEE